MSEIVNFQGITKRFGEVVALKDINLAVGEGEFLSLLGPSGCGKTTLLRTCAGLESPDQGRVYLEGVDVTDTPPYRRPVNMVFQRWALFPHKTVAENIAFGLVVKKTRSADIPRRIKSMLELVKMQGYEDRYPRQLSGGQAQRIALARALVLNPRVLLLDEPLGSLDLKLRKEMQIELINIHKQLGTTFIYVTHDQEEALTMSNRVVLMNQGAIIQDGSPTEVYQKPGSVFTAQFIGEGIFFFGEVVAIEGSRARIRCGDLVLAGSASPGLQVGRQATLCLRPERVHLACQPRSGVDNQLEGNISNTIFKGSLVNYHVQIQGGQVVHVNQNLEQDIPLYTAQSPLYLTWSAENCVILAE